MRLWSLHPRYLDAKGLTAAWREGLLAKKVIEGKTKGYKQHPQLIRFQECLNPIAAINLYLNQIYNESLLRGYRFDITKLQIHTELFNVKINVTNMQVKYETELLKQKLLKRDKCRYHSINKEIKIDVNTLFKIVPGEIEYWEKTIPGIMDYIK